MDKEVLAQGRLVSVRKIEIGDLNQIVKYGFSVSITEPLTDIKRLNEVFSKTGLWLDESGAVAIVENTSGRMVGSLQYFRSAPCIHGFELGYITHDVNDRGNGYAAEGLRLISDYLFSTIPTIFRHQLTIEVGNTASWKVAQRCDFLREGLMRSSGFGTNPADCFLYSRTSKDYAHT